jgi:hypothetical protein
MNVFKVKAMQDVGPKLIRAVYWKKLFVISKFCNLTVATSNGGKNVKRHWFLH